MKLVWGLYDEAMWPRQRFVIAKRRQNTNEFRLQINDTAPTTLRKKRKEDSLALGHYSSNRSPPLVDLRAGCVARHTGP